MSRPMMVGKFLIVCLFVSWIYGAKVRKKLSIIRFTNITTDFNPNNSELVTFAVTPKSNGRSFDIYWKLSRTIPSQMNLGVDAFVKTNNTSRNIFSYDFDTCRLWDGFMSQTIARTWFRNIKKYGNMSVTCPVQKGIYFLNKMDIDLRSVPPFIANGKYMALFRLYIKKKTMRDMLFNSTIEVEVQR